MVDTFSMENKIREMEEKVYNTEEVAKIMKVSTMTIHRLVKQNKLKSFRCGHLVRFTESEIMDFIRKNEK